MTRVLRATKRVRVTTTPVIRHWSDAEVRQHEAEEARRHAASVAKATAHEQRFSLETRLRKLSETLAEIERKAPERHVVYNVQVLMASILREIEAQDEPSDRTLIARLRAVHPCKRERDKDAGFVRNQGGRGQVDRSWTCQGCGAMVTL